MKTESGFAQRAVAAFDNHIPNQGRPKGYGEVPAHPENAHPGSNTGKLRKDVSEVGDCQHRHGEEGDPHAEFFADEVGEPLSGGYGHARGHFLDYDERNGGGNQRPQESVAILGSRLGVCEDASGIVIDIGGDETGA